MINRRTFVKTVAGGAAALALTKQHAGAQTRGNQPNVLFVSIDDINDWIGALGGHPDVRTPRLDELASRGTLFTRAYCSVPVCNGSRVSTLTGLHPFTTGVYNNSQRFDNLDPVPLTLPAYFLQQDYLVFGAGKVFHKRNEGTWDDYTWKIPDPLPPGRPLNGIPGAGDFDWGPVNVSDERMGDARVVDWASEKLQQNHLQPFFLACGLFKPHLPWYVPQPYFDLYPPASITLPEVLANDLDDIPPIGQEWANPDRDHARVLQTNNWQKAVAGYLAAITFADTQFGRLLDALDQSRYANDTIIILWSDHGWHLGEKLHWRKFALWEEATRVPLIVVAPGVTSPGTVCERTVSLLDLFPTLIDLCMLPAIDAHEGRSLVPLLEDPAAPWDHPALTTWLPDNHSLRTERWRYIRYNDGTEELYDHDVDPLEWHNLANEAGYAGEKARLAAQLLGQVPTSISPPVPEVRPALAQNYPNPFSQDTTIEFVLPEPGSVRMTIYSAQGVTIRELVQRHLSRGHHVIQWDGRNAAGRPVASGLYFCRLQAGSFVETRRLLLIR